MAFEMYGVRCEVDCWYQSDKVENAGVCENDTGGGCPLTEPSDVSERETIEVMERLTRRSERAPVSRWWRYDHEGD
jgi:hypothetical protein